MDSSNGKQGNQGSSEKDNLWRVKVGLAEMLKGGVIMDVTTAEQARIAEQAGACAVMALERVPADIRKEGGVARMASPRIIREIMRRATIPVWPRAPIGHLPERPGRQRLSWDCTTKSKRLPPPMEENTTRNT